MDSLNINNKVLVCGSDNLTTLGIIRELGSYNIKFTLLAIGGSSVMSKSRYCGEVINLPNIESCIAYLEGNYENELYKPIIIISSDRLASYFDEHQEELSKKYILPVSNKPGKLSYYTNKFNMFTLADSMGINILRSHKINKSSPLEDIEYPCFIKPCIETPGHYNEFKYKICKNKDELKKTLKMVRPTSEFIVQRLLKKESELVVYGCRMRDGKVVISGVMYQDRFAESGFASHGTVTSSIPDYIDVGKLVSFVKEVDFYGPFDFEFGIENNTAYYFETNFRCVGPTGFFNKSGASVVAAYVYSSAGLDYTQIPLYVSKDNVCIDDMYDIENVIVRRLSYKEWKQSMSSVTLRRYFDHQDMGPYYAEKKRRFRIILKDILLKRLRLYVVYLKEKVTFI